MWEVFGDFAQICNGLGNPSMFANIRKNRTLLYILGKGSTLRKVWEQSANCANSQKEIQILDFSENPPNSGIFGKRIQNVASFREKIQTLERLKKHILEIM